MQTNLETNRNEWAVDHLQNIQNVKPSRFVNLNLRKTLKVIVLRTLAFKSLPQFQNYLTDVENPSYLLDSKYVQTPTSIALMFLKPRNPCHRHLEVLKLCW